MAIQPVDVGLLKNHRLRRVLESRLLGRVAQNALVYSLLILVVEETGSSVHTAILLCAFTLPGIVLGHSSGAAADILQMVYRRLKCRDTRRWRRRSTRTGDPPVT